MLLCIYSIIIIQVIKDKGPFTHTQSMCCLLALSSGDHEPEPTDANTELWALLFYFLYVDLVFSVSATQTSVTSLIEGLLSGLYWSIIWI